MMGDIGFSDGEIFSSSQIFILISFVLLVFILSFSLRKKNNFLLRLIPKESEKFATVKTQKIDTNTSLYAIEHNDAVYLVFKSPEGTLLLNSTNKEEKIDV